MYRTGGMMGLSASTGMESVQLRIPPIAGFGASPPAPATLQLPSETIPPGERPKPIPWSEVPIGTKLLILGVPALLIGGIGYLVYKDIQLKFKIAEKEGAAGLLKYEVGKAATGAAVSLLDEAISPSDRRARANPRRRKRHARRRRG